MEDEQAVTGEETPTPSAGETESVVESGSSEADTLDQPTDTTTGAEDAPKPSRAQERIRELNREANYWKDLALAGNAPSEDKPAATEESDGVGLDDIANAVVTKLEQKARLTKADQAQKAMYEDALTATAEFPELDSDERLAKRVIAIAQADGISIVEAARDYLGSTKKVSRSTAETAARANVAAPSARKVSTGEAATVDLNSLSESDKAANWDKIISKMSQSE